MALHPVTWNWKDKRDGEDVEYGFIAQEVEKIIPSLVSEGTWRDGTTRKFLTLSDLLPYLVVAIQEQQTQIAQLQERLAKNSKP